MPKRGPVLHLLGSLARGGAETVTLDLIRAIGETGVRNIVVCLSGNAGELEEDYRAAGAEIVLVDVFGRPVSSLIRLIRLGRSVDASAVVSNVSLPSAVFLLPFLLVRVPVRIARFHSDSDGRTSTLFARIRRIGLLALMRISATRVLAVGPGALEFAGGRGEVLPNGIDTTQFRHTERVEGERFNVLNVGRPDPAKNRERLKGISRELIRLGVNPIRVVGQAGEDVGPDDEPDIQFAGPKSPIAPEYALADCLVIVSIREGLPGVLLESLASGVPVVASDLPGIRQVARDLPGITLVDLEEPDEVWAQRIVDACAVRRTAYSRMLSESVATSEYAASVVNARWIREFGLADVGRS